MFIRTVSQAIATWIACRFGISYTAEGLVPLLHRLGFCYKKTKQVPCEANVSEQEAFVKSFEELLMNKTDKEAVFFADSVHPQHNTRSTYAWVEKGKEKEIPSVSGRQRIHLHGAFTVEKPEEVHIQESQTVNAQSTWELYQKIEQAHPDKNKIYVITDNARYYKNKTLQEKLKNSRMVQIFLPAYSPPLNLIERLWKFMRKKVIDTHFTRTFEKFKQKILLFFQNIAQYKEELQSLLTPKFHLPFSQTNFY